MATRWEKEELQQAVERGLEPLKDSVSLIAAELFALREAIHDGENQDVDRKIKSVQIAITRCMSQLNQRMESFERRLRSGIDRRVRDADE